MNKYTQEQKTQDFVADYYEGVRFAIPYSRKYQFWFFRKLVGYLKPHGLILDNGCGTGHLGEVLPQEKIVGVDLSQEMVERARKRLYKVYQASAEKLPFPEDHFDTIFCRSLLHHLEKPRLAVDEVYRVLKPGGKVLFSDTLKNPITVIPREIMRRKSDHFSEGHKNFARQELLNLVEEKLLIKSTHYIGFVAYTLFGFPDVINFQKFIPFKSIFYPIFLGLDNILSKLPIINRLAANIVVIAEKR